MDEDERYHDPFEGEDEDDNDTEGEEGDGFEDDFDDGEDLEEDDDESELELYPSETVTRWNVDTWEEYRGEK